MRIGNLSRAGRPSGGHSGRLLRVLSLAGIGAMILAGWQILPFALNSDPSGRASTAALTASEAPGRALGHGEPQAKRPPAAPAPVRAAAAPESPAPAPAATAPRVVYSGPLVTSSAAPGVAQPPAPVRSLAPASAPIPAPAPVAEPAPAPRAAPEPAPQRVAAAAPPAVEAAPAAGGRVDLNAASVEELNAIPGAGLIGRAIVRGRPYASPEDLVTKRILNRAAFERIKDQITAQ